MHMVVEYMLEEVVFMGVVSMMDMEVVFMRGHSGEGHMMDIICYHARASGMDRYRCGSVGVVVSGCVGGCVVCPGGSRDGYIPGSS